MEDSWRVICLLGFMLVFFHPGLCVPAKKVARDGSRTIDMRMPGVRPHEEDKYLCTSMAVPRDENYIVKYEALANASTAHHMLLFGCKTPYSRQGQWECGYICGSGHAPKIMFAWAKDAPPTQLPEDVGFRVGGSSGIKYLVLQIHYRRIIPASEPKDKSGLRMTITPEKQKYLAGIFLLMAYDFSIPADKKVVHGDVSCKFDGPAPIYPFAFRTHAHDLGRVISGFQYNGSFHLLGRGNPQWPQAFYPMTEKFKIEPGDYLIGRCTYDSSNRHRQTDIGATHNDEMCNFYMMYYTDAKKGDVYGDCGTNEYPRFFKNLPPGSDAPLPLKPNFKTHQAEVTVIPDWPHIIPDDHVTLGQVAGVAVDADGQVHIFHRGNRAWDGTSFDSRNYFQHVKWGPIKENTLVVFDASSGKVIKQWGANLFYMPHGLHIDKDNNIWLTDVALHQVFKFNKGEYDKPALVLGDKLKPGKGDNQFCKPTDVATLSTGEFYVSDGYCNSRIIKYSPDGKKLFQWGKMSQQDENPPLGTFSIPHSLTVLEDKERICVADRENGRVQCFSLDGKNASQITSAEFNGRLFAVSYDKNTGVLYAVDGPEYFAKDSKVQGFTLDPDTGDILDRWSPTDKGFDNPHDVQVSGDGKALYVGEIMPNKLWKFKLNLPSKSKLPPVKKGIVHPASSDNSLETGAEEKIAKTEEGDFVASLIIGALLIVPVIIVIITTITLRLRAKGRGNKRKNISYTKLLVEDKVALLEN